MSAHQTDAPSTNGSGQQPRTPSLKDISFRPTKEGNNDPMQLITQHKPMKVRKTKVKVTPMTHMPISSQRRRSRTLSVTSRLKGHNGDIKRSVSFQISKRTGDHFGIEKSPNQKVNDNKSAESDNAYSINSQASGDYGSEIDRMSGPIEFEHTQKRHSNSSTVLREVLHRFGDKNRPVKLLVDDSNKLIDLLDHDENLRQDLFFESTFKYIRCLLLNNDTIVVSCGFKILRYITTDYSSLVTLVKSYIQSFIIHSLAKDPKKSTERTEAIRLMRHFFDIKDGFKLLEVGTMKALVCIMENSSDPLRDVAIESVCELSVLSPQLSYRAHGLSALIQIVVEGTSRMTSLCYLTIEHLLTIESSRKLLLPEGIIEKLISPFMDVVHIKVEKLQRLAYVLICLLKLWPGLLVFSENNFSALKQLIDCLKFDSSPVTLILIQCFYDLLRIRPFPWISLNPSDIYGHGSAIVVLRQLKMNPHSKPTSFKGLDKENCFVNHYTALILRVLLECGLWTKLTEIFENSTDNKLKKKIVRLLSELSYLQMTLIPKQLRTVGSPSFELNTLLDKDIRRRHKVGILPPSIVHKKALVEKSLVVPTSAVKLLATSTGYDRNLINVLTPKNIQMKFKDPNFQFDIKTCVINTQVLTTKDYVKWDWDLIMQLLQAPLRNPQVFEDVTKNTKLFKRLLSFYRPFKYRFSTLRRTKSNLIYVKVGCEIFRCLLSHKQGVKYLSENKILPQIAECLAQMDPYSGITAADALFSKKKLETTLCSYFFKFLGILSADPNGIKMMEQWWIFDMLYHITDKETGRDDLVQIVLKDLKYNLLGHPRILLLKVASTGSLTNRLVATKILGDLLNNSPENELFACKALSNQLCDCNSRVRNKAVESLTLYARDPAKVDILISFRPSLENLGTQGAQLMRALFMSSSGFEYLQSQLNFVETEMETWVETKDRTYVGQVESFIAKRLLNISGVEISDMPYHFFGSLAKTVDGIQLIESSGSFSSFTSVINTFCDVVKQGGESAIYTRMSEHESNDTILELKAAIWAVGHISSSKYGVSLLEVSGSAEQIAYLAENCTDYSVKGTCFFALGLLAETKQGEEILDDLGWCSTRSSLGDCVEIALPRKLDQFFKHSTTTQVTTIPSVSSVQIFEDIMEESFVPFHDNETVQEDCGTSSNLPGILGSSSYESSKYSKEYLTLYNIYENLNLVLVNQARAYNNLGILKRKHPKLFESEPTVLMLILNILDLYRVKSSVRSYFLTELINFNGIMETIFTANNIGLSNQISKSSPSRTPLPRARSLTSLSPAPTIRRRKMTASSTNSNCSGNNHYTVPKVASSSSLSHENSDSSMKSSLKAC